MGSFGGIFGAASPVWGIHQRARVVLNRATTKDAAAAILAVGLGILAFAHSQVMLWLAWLILGLGMGIGLYDTAFAALGRIYGLEARSAITGITLLAGFASTVGWPLTAWGASEFGWRETCLAWAAAHIVLGLSLNLLLPTSSSVTVSTDDSSKPHIPIDRPMLVLGLAFAASWMVVTAMAVHLPRLLEAAGATTVQAVAAGALIGPAQVGARILEASLMKRFHPMVSARLSVALHPIGAAVLALCGTSAASAPFTILHGAGSGILTIARGTVPLAIFGPQNYGYRLGLLGAPTRVWRRRADLLVRPQYRGARRSMLVTHQQGGVQVTNSQRVSLGPIADENHRVRRRISTAVNGTEVVLQPDSGEGSRRRISLPGPPCCLARICPSA